ncbi:ribonuclease HII [Paenarthrobacter sp. Z7-10]|uniref:ribonuclease HII n=1 Tax=Paenarthrobacter sp. Z7-10 TaxID=2787635 RepID=UPI0022A9DB49|nr:ribonuclease HII [Paenarthrobacter sp. Z7-10]MCZ2403874.1 ribonuclease HII [Paenarthrobacter sp. Z7-10]
MAVRGKAVAAPTLRYERSFLADGRRLIAGCDEVGRGSLAGPVSVGMVVIDASAQRSLGKVRDSKLLTAATRMELVPKIQRWAVAHSVGHASAAEIDAHGLIAALRLAGTRAWLQILASGIAPELVILDGNHNWLSPRAQSTLFGPESGPDFGELEAAASAEMVTAAVVGPDLEGRSCDAPVYTKIKADMQCLSVAAASVLAKVERDGMLCELDAAHPQYGWALNKGYATAAHRAAIVEHGPSPYHRLSWRLTADVPGRAGEDGKEAEVAEEAVEGEVEEAASVEALAGGR